MKYPLIAFALLILCPPSADARQTKGKSLATGRLSSFVTRFNPSNRKRSLNIRVALKKLDKATIKPGQTFSINSRLGKRTQANGYRTAIVFEDGKKVAGIGGGVSQVTGTLFNAALLAGLPIQEFHAHSRPVPYLPVGRDATVAYGEKDLKFKNNTSAPLRLSFRVSGNKLTASFHGLKRSRKQVRLSVVKRAFAKNHIEAKLYRKFKQNGRIVRTELVGTSTYKWTPELPD